MIINNLDLRIFDFVNVFLVSHFYHEPLARETGQPLPVYLTVNKLYLIPYTNINSILPQSLPDHFTERLISII